MATTYHIIPELTAKQVRNFRAKYIESSQHECWEWTAYRTPDGYGKLCINYTAFFAHRIAYFLATGDDPGPLEVKHSCDNPPCVNPAHLAKDTHMGNMADMVRRGRSASGDRQAFRVHPEVVPRGKNHYWNKHPEKRLRGEQASKAKLTNEQVIEIRRLYDTRQATRKELREQFRVGQTTIQSIVTRKAWTHLD